MKYRIDILELPLSKEEISEIIRKAVREAIIEIQREEKLQLNKPLMDPQLLESYHPTSPRIAKAFSRMGVRTWKDVCEVDLLDLRMQKNIGQHTIRSVYYQLKDRSLEFKNWDIYLAHYQDARHAQEIIDEEA